MASSNVVSIIWDNGFLPVGPKPLTRPRLACQTWTFKNHRSISKVCEGILQWNSIQICDIFISAYVHLKISAAKCQPFCSGCVYSVKNFPQRFIHANTRPGLASRFPHKNLVAIMVIICLKLFCMSQYRNRPISLIPHCTSPTSHNALFCNRNVHMCAHFCYKLVHCGIFDALWDLWNGCYRQRPCYVQMLWHFLSRF